MISGLRRVSPVLVVAALLAGCEPAVSPEEQLLIGPGTTEQDFIDTQNDQALFPELTPAGASMARAFINRPDTDMGPLLAAAISQFDCSVPVTDEEIEGFEAWVGTDYARAVGMPDEDIAKVAPGIGARIVQSGTGQLPEGTFAYDADLNLIGLPGCL